MQVLDPGHQYRLLTLDGEREQTLTFVKRQGPGYPGNNSEYPGTTLQDVIHCLLERTRYLDKQIPCIQNKVIINNLQGCLLALEERAAKRHGVELEAKSLDELEAKPLCPSCGHTTCHCH